LQDTNSDYRICEVCRYLKWDRCSQQSYDSY